MDRGELTSALPSISLLHRAAHQPCRSRLEEFTPAEQGEEGPRQIQSTKAQLATDVMLKAGEQ